jgi:ketosteroid isomerase-like protein
MPAHSPAEVHRLFAQAFNVGEVVALAALYEPSALLVVGGNEVVGRESIRKTFEGLCAPGDRIAIQTLAVTAAHLGVAVLPEPGTSSCRRGPKPQGRGSALKSFADSPTVRGCLS